MLQVRNLSVTHREDCTPVIEDLSFVLAPGDRAAVIGEEGNGKSTLLKLLYDPALVEPYADWTGELPSARLKRGYLAQELREAELEMPVGKYCRRNGLDHIQPRDLHQLAQRMSLDGGLFTADRPMSSLSGGERVKLRLALLLLQNPDVLLLDEPSNDLDLDTLDWLESFLLSCPLPVLYVSHDTVLLERTANLIIHLERIHRRSLPRCTVSRSSYRDYVQGREDAFSQQERVARKERAEFDAKMEKYRQIRDKVEHQQAVISRGDPHGAALLKKKMHSTLAMGRRFAREAEHMTPMPEWEEAILTAFDEQSATIPAGKTILRLQLPVLAVGERVLARNVELSVTGPERIGIVGPNGCGKSTLLKHIAGELLPRRDIRAAYMPQDYGDLLTGALTPVEILAPSGDRSAVTRARTLLGSMKYKAEEMEHPSAGLSGGQRAKLLFLSMVLQGSNVLLLDEPTRNFSPLSAPVILQVLSSFPGTVLSVSHDRRYLEAVCTRVLMLTENGLVPT